MFLCLGHLIWRCPLSGSLLLRGLASLLCYLLLCFKYTFQADLLTTLGQSHMKWSGLPHLKQFLFFFWYNSTTLVKLVMYSMGWSASYASPDASASLPAEGPVFSSPSHSSCRSPSAMSFPMVTSQVAKVQLPFSLHEGKRFAWVWECIMFDPLVTAIYLIVGPWPLPIFPAFVQLAAGQNSWLGVHYPLYDPVFANV